MTLMKKRDFMKATVKLVLGSISAFYLEPFMLEVAQNRIKFDISENALAGLDVISDTIPQINWPVKRNFGIIEIGDSQLRA